MIGAKRSGFTLMEMVVVMAIFVILITSFSEIYLRSSRTAQQIALRARLQADTRLALEAIARAARVANIDYASYGGTLPAQPMTELRLANADTANYARVRSEATDVGCYNDTKSFPCITVSTDNGVSWTPLSPRNTRVEYLRFYASPSQDPFLLNPGTGTYPANTAPRITVVFGLRGLAARAEDEWVNQVQTTITPRYYKR